MVVVLTRSSVPHFAGVAMTSSICAPQGALLRSMEVCRGGAGSGVDGSDKSNGQECTLAGISWSDVLPSVLLSSVHVTRKRPSARPVIEAPSDHLRNCR